MSPSAALRPPVRDFPVILPFSRAQNWETTVNKPCVFKPSCTVQENALAELQLFNQIHVTMSLKVLANSREKKKNPTQLEERDIKTSCLLTPTTVNSF